MPGRDGTGPQGKGPRTGRQHGACAEAQPQGRGFGRGRGTTLGRRRNE
ncbi:DUF5320 domain-containing protein [Candidatus Woesearchaeota archaeon]|nr:DUF5320 domain-containing protein [Candidatus Woesearchaeota archaeon]